MITLSRGDNQWREIEAGVYRAFMMKLDTATSCGLPYLEIRDNSTKKIIVDGKMEVLRYFSKKESWALNGDYATDGGTGWRYFLDFGQDVKIAKWQYEWRIKFTTGGTEYGFNEYDFIIGQEAEATKIPEFHQLDCPKNIRYMTFDVHNMNLIRFLGTLQNIRDVEIIKDRETIKFPVETLILSALSVTTGEIKRNERKATIKLNLLSSAETTPIIVKGAVSNIKYGV